MSGTSIIDNLAENTLLAGLQRMGGGGRQLRIATAFFSLNALLLLADTLEEFEHVQILFGDDADAQQRLKLLEMLRRESDKELREQRETVSQLSPLKKVEALFEAGRIEARCYTSKKFHAKAYLVHRPHVYPAHLGVIGSGNFTRPGLLQNIELNVELAPEQVGQLAAWYEERWDEAAADIVTEDVLAEIRRQITLYDPYVLYCKALALWGERQQGIPGHAQTALAGQLDPHQFYGFSQAVKIIEREQGVMVCDGVGLGKSFIALALMEHFCRLGKNVLLIAPKSVFETSWKGYLSRYLAPYIAPFGNVYPLLMTSLGFDPEEGDGENEGLRERRELIRQLARRADVLVIDESHNFRATAASRYRNLYSVIEPQGDKRKKTILLTATPINTEYRDLSAQMALITHEAGGIGGYRIDQIRRLTREMDKDARARKDVSQLQLSLGLGQPEKKDLYRDDLGRVLESVVIQRSRKTCKALSEATGRPLRFPHRCPPETINYQIGPESGEYRALVSLAQKRFQPGVALLQKMQQELRAAEEKGVPLKPVKVPSSLPRGIKLAAFLTEQYRRAPAEGVKTYRDEVHLAGLVFTNTLKQLESSPVAFQGILQSLAVGLIGRLRVVLGAEAKPIEAQHEDWVRTPLFARSAGLVAEPDPAADTPSDLDTDGDTLDASGTETDDWLDQAIAQRQLKKKLAGFREPEYHVTRWRDDIVSDLDYLREIHEATRRARRQPDPKLETVLLTLRGQMAAGRRVLLFTQSRRTAEYLEAQLTTRLPDSRIARIDSRVDKTRAAILYGFCPGYNPPAAAPSVPARIDLLISTDVLSEGVNLQETGAVFNYDIHWNPVRLIQRIGRVDRRLDPAITPEEHDFSIFNVLPPPEIDAILDLVGVIENRTIRISRTLGLDEAFFKSSDPSGTLIEYNHLLDGDTPPRDAALIEYARQAAAPDPAMQRLLDQLPDGAFGVWKEAPLDGLFALWTLRAAPKAPPSDRERFGALLGRPLLALERAGQTPLFDAGEILALLAGTSPGQHSATPSDEGELGRRLKTLRDAARQQFAALGLPNTIRPQLVCWMELRRDQKKE